MYEDFIPPTDQQNPSVLRHKYLLAKQRRKELELKVAKSQGSNHLLQSKIDKQHLRQTIYDHVYNKFYRAADIRRQLRKDRLSLNEKRRETLSQLQERTSHAKSLRECRPKHAKHSIISNKTREAKMSRSFMSQMQSRTHEERQLQNKSKLWFRQKEMLDGVYRIENIASKDVQLLYLKTIDSHKKAYHYKLERRENLLRIKEDIEVSGLQRWNVIN